MRQTFAISAAWTAAAGSIEQAVSAFIFITIARLIGAEAFGVAAMAFAFLFLGEFLVRETLTESIVERKSLETGRLEATFVVLLGFGAIITLALAIVAQLAASIYDEPKVADLLLAASPAVMLLGAAGVPTAILRRNLAYRALAIRSVAGVVIGGIVGVIMAIEGCGASSLVGQRLAQAGSNAALAILAARWRPAFWPKREHFKLLRGLGPEVLFLRSLTLIISQTPIVALGVFADARIVGLYGFAARVTEIVAFLVVYPLKSVAQSALAEARRQHVSTARFFLDLTELSAFCAFTAFAGLALISDPTVAILVGAQWRDASAILPFLCAAGAVMSLSATQEAYLLALGNVGSFARATLIEAAIGIVLVAAASSFGPVAAGAAVAARAFVALPFRTRAALAAEHLSASAFLRAASAPLLAAGGVVASVGAWRIAMLGQLPDTLFLLSAIAIGVISFCAILFGTMPNALQRLRWFVDGAA